MININRPQTFSFLAAFVLLTVFCLNALTPPVFDIDSLYLCVMVMVFKQDSRTIIIFGCCVCALIIINMLIYDLNERNRRSKK